MSAIYTLKLGMALAYLLKGRDGWLLIDAGVPGTAGRIVQKMNAFGVAPHTLRLAVVTHVHYDHVGGLAKVVRACGCPVMAHRDEAETLARGEMSMPDGQIFLTRLVARLARKHPSVTAWVTRYEPVKADLLVSGDTSLESLGFAATVIPTPGHSRDSLTVLTDDGHAFVGDLAYNELPLVHRTHVPPFACDRAVLLESWKLLLDRGARVIHPGHGDAFSADKLRRGLHDKL